tara:strand:+ start:9000 stop:9497 length:498 start_codon:yes stop_codon:yes gene_type:complete
VTPVVLSILSEGDVRLLICFLLVLVCTPCFASEAYVISCENVEEMVILEAPGNTWGIETSNGLYYTLFVMIKPEFVDSHKHILKSNMAFRDCEQDTQLQISYHDIDLVGSGREIMSDTKLGTQYGDSNVSITRRDKSEIIDIAGRICPSKVPLRIFKPNDLGPYN